MGAENEEGRPECLAHPNFSIFAYLNLPVPSWDDKKRAVCVFQTFLKLLFTLCFLCSFGLI